MGRNPTKNGSNVGRHVISFDDTMKQKSRQGADGRSKEDIQMNLRDKKWGVLRDTGHQSAASCRGWFVLAAWGKSADF